MDEDAKREADEMREAGHDEAAAAHLISGLIDDDSGLPNDDGEKPDEPEEIEDEIEEDDASEESDVVEDVDEDDGDEDSDDEPSDDADDEPRVFKVPVEDGDGFEEITRDEYESRQLRMADYTRKTQELAKQRKAVEAEMQARRDERQKYADGLGELTEIMQAIAPAEPDWEKVKEEDSQGFPERFQAYQKQVKMLGDIEAERERVRQESAEESKTILAQMQLDRDEFLQASVPGWADLDKAREEMAGLVKYANDVHGFTVDMISEVVDPQVFLMLRKSMLYDKMTATGKEVRKKAKKGLTLKPGPSGSTESKSKKKEDAARSRLERTGHVRDAASLLEKFID